MVPTTWAASSSMLSQTDLGRDGWERPPDHLQALMLPWRYAAWTLSLGRVPGPPAGACFVVYAALPGSQKDAWWVLGQPRMPEMCSRGCGGGDLLNFTPQGSVAGDMASVVPQPLLSHISKDSGVLKGPGGLAGAHIPCVSVMPSRIRLPACGGPRCHCNFPSVS